eukprot:scaffold5391_cov171-Amphora_coffeaeformis.AAC.8
MADIQQNFVRFWKGIYEILQVSPTVFSARAEQGAVVVDSFPGTYIPPVIHVGDGSIGKVGNRIIL